jgi:type II secretion system protein H
MLWFTFDGTQSEAELAAVGPHRAKMRCPETCMRGLPAKPGQKPAILARLDLSPCYSGFALIELLVVLVILSVMIGLIALNLQGGESQRASREQALLALLENARDYAASEGVGMAVSFTLAGEPLVRERKSDDTWIAHSLSGSAMGARFQVRELRLAGRPVSVNQPIIFSPEGLTTPFDLTIAQATSDSDSQRGVIVVSGDRLARIGMRAL